ncbi:mitochondrial ribosomal protein S6 [Arctopsyche grandis]|uniref:mitochondrial ribosomal protein S6 n=1 Tax=Arctopsyche grandis TaxID=121162 RepID=UPI00406D95E0
MPTYEAALLIRTMPLVELKTSLARIAKLILNQKGIIRSIDSLGHQPTPFKISCTDSQHREAHYFIIKFDSNIKMISRLRDEYNRDVDVVRQQFYKVRDERAISCELEKESQPPAYREEVQEMMKQGKKQQNPFTYKFKYNSGMTHYPFQK